MWVLEGKRGRDGGEQTRTFFLRIMEGLQYMLRESVSKICCMDLVLVKSSVTWLLFNEVGSESVPRTCQSRLRREREGGRER